MFEQHGFSSQTGVPKNRRQNSQSSNTCAALSNQAGKAKMVICRDVLSPKSTLNLSFDHRSAKLQYLLALLTAENQTVPWGRLLRTLPSLYQLLQTLWYPLVPLGGESSFSGTLDDHMPASGDGTSFGLGCPWLQSGASFSCQCTHDVQVLSQKSWLRGASGGPQPHVLLRADVHR